MNPKETTCIIIDDELQIRDRLESLLLKFDHIKVLSKEGVPEPAIKKVLELKPDIVFVDVEMPRMNGFDVVKAIREKQFYPTFIFVTAYNQYAIKAIKNEAFDFLLKPVDIEELAQTLERYQNKTLLKQETEKKNIYGKLSVREFEILEFLKQGLSSKDIAEKLNISKTTVDTHRRNILEKTGMKSTAELIARR